MTIRAIAPYRARALEGLQRIGNAANSLVTLVQHVEAMNLPIVNDEPTLIRDIEFLATEIERLASTAQRKAISPDPKA